MSQNQHHQNSLQKPQNKSKEFEIELLPNGQIRAGRSNLEFNDELFQIISLLIGDEQRDSLKKFFDDAKETKTLFGKERLCG